MTLKQRVYAFLFNLRYRSAKDSGNGAVVSPSK
jgi:hypothetical protein